MWMVVLALALTGCNQVYGLDGTTAADPPDAPDPPDGDHDGVIDLDDNCPAVANVDQFDSDADGRGDRCDDCPLIANGANDDFEHDGIGDACDPHPETKDCLLLVDSFADPATFEPNWTTTGRTPLTTVTAEPGHISITPESSAVVTILSNMPPGPVPNVIVRGTRVIGDTTAVAAVTAFQSTSAFYGCEMGPVTASVVTGMPLTNQAGRFIPGAVVTTGFVNRLIIDPNQITNDVLCRIEWGVSIATNGLYGTMVRTGAAGVMITGGPNVDSMTTITLDAISLTAPLATCPPTIYR